MAPGRATSFGPTRPTSCRTSAMNLGRQGRWPEAIAYYEQGLRLKPDLPEMHRNLAYALLCAANTSAAGASMNGD